MLTTDVTLNEYNEFQITGSSSEFPNKFHVFIQTLLRINDMILVKKENVIKMFVEDVLSFFANNDITGTPKKSLIGKTGIEYEIDFHITNKIHKNGRKLIQIKNSLSFDDFTSQSFMFQDITELEENSVDIDTIQNIIMTGVSQNKLPKKVQQAAQYKSIKILTFSDNTHDQEVILNSLKN